MVEASVFVTLFGAAKWLWETGRGGVVVEEGEGMSGGVITCEPADNGRLPCPPIEISPVSARRSPGWGGGGDRDLLERGGGKGGRGSEGGRGSRGEAPPPAGTYPIHSEQKIIGE